MSSAEAEGQCASAQWPLPEVAVKTVTVCCKHNKIYFLRPLRIKTRPKLRPADSLAGSFPADLSLLTLLLLPLPVIILLLPSLLFEPGQVDDPIQ